MSDEAPAKAPMHIKSVPVATRRLMLGLATKQGQTLAEWLAQTVDLAARMQAGERVLPPLVPGQPGRPGQTLGQTLGQAFGQTPGQPGTTAPAVVNARGFAELAVALRAARELADAAGVPVPRSLARHALALLAAQLREARGLPPRRAGKTLPQIGQTCARDADRTTIGE